MRWIAYCLIVLASSWSTAAQCDHVKLVACLSEVLDDYSMMLWRTKKNIIAMSDEDCEHVHAMGRCIDDEDHSNQHGCTRQEVLESSKTLSDLLLHRQNVGTFVKSYYLLQYGCSPAGREIIREHRDCLYQEGIGKATLSATTYLSKKFVDNAYAEGDQQACNDLEMRLDQYKRALFDVCAKASAAKLMCESVQTAIKSTYPVETSHCTTLNCEVSGEELDTTNSIFATEPNPDARVQHAGLNGQQAHTGAAQSPRTSILSAISVILLALVLRL